MTDQPVALKIGLTKDQEVMVDLGQDYRYLTLTPEQALTLAGWLSQYANKSTKAPRQN